MSSKPEQFAVVSPFNLFPDGSSETKVIGVGTASYADGGGFAVFLIFEDGGGQPVSVNLPERTSLLGTDEFFLKNWTECEHIAKILEEQGLVVNSGKAKVQYNHVNVPIYKLDHSKLRGMSDAEKERYAP